MVQFNFNRSYCICSVNVSLLMSISDLVPLLVPCIWCNQPLIHEQKLDKVTISIPKLSDKKITFSTKHGFWILPHKKNISSDITETKKQHCAKELWNAA